jgi:hypothetical protein
MPRRKATSEQLRQQSLIGFLQPHLNSPQTGRSRTQLGPAGRTAGVTEIPIQSDSDSDVEAIHFEPRKEPPLDDDEIQPSSPKKRRRIAVEVRPLADRGTSTTSTSNNSDDSIELNRRESPSTKMKRPISRSPSTELDLDSHPKRRRLAKGTRPSSTEEPDDLLGEVNETGESQFRP